MASWQILTCASPSCLQQACVQHVCANEEKLAEVTRWLKAQHGDTDKTHTEAVRQDGSARFLKNWKVIQVVESHFCLARSGQNTRSHTQSTKKLICMCMFETVVWWRWPCCFHFKPSCSLTHTTDTPRLTLLLTQRWSMKVNASCR